MQADHHSQERLEAVAEALYIAAVPDSAVPWEDAVFQIKDRYRHLARAALAASRQPVSGGSEGEVEKAARWLWDYDTSGNDGAWDETEREEYRDTAKDLLAALSRVPADGEQPAGRWTIYVCPGCGNWAAPADLEPRFGNIVVHDKPTGDCSADPLKVEVVPASPADGPVSASRPPEEDFAWKGDDKHPDWQDYVATNLLDTLQRTPDTGDWHGAMRTWCEQHSTGRLKPNPWPDGGLGDRQLNPEQATAAFRHLDPYWQGDEATEVREVLRRLASGENPDR